MTANLENPENWADPEAYKKYMEARRNAHRKLKRGSRRRPSGSPKKKSTMRPASPVVLWLN